MLLLAILTSAPAACNKGPWCVCQSLFLDFRPVLLLAVFLHANWQAFRCRGPYCVILGRLLELELMLLLAFLPSP